MDDDDEEADDPDAAAALIDNFVIRFNVDFKMDAVPFVFSVNVFVVATSTGAATAGTCNVGDPDELLRFKQVEEHDLSIRLELLFWSPQLPAGALNSSAEAARFGGEFDGLS